MGYMKVNKIKGHKTMSIPQKKAAGGKIKVTYATEDGSTCEQLLSADDKVMVIPESPRPGMVLKKVTNVFRGETMEWLHILTSTGEEITCTQEHPFSVNGKGWVVAGALQPDDQFLTADGKECYVVRTWIEKLDKPETTYNFEVEDCHNYFVGNSGILVHNICVAQEGKFRADVKKGGDPNHANTGHAHIYEGSKNLGSVKADGTVMAGTIKGKAADFVSNHLDEIAKGIDEFYWIGRIKK